MVHHGTIARATGSHGASNGRRPSAGGATACYVCGLSGDTTLDSSRRQLARRGPILLPISPPPVLSEETLSRYVRALYPVGLLLVTVPVVDLVLRSLPPQFGTLQWRFATVGLLLGNYGTLILGAALVGLTAALLGERGVLRAVGIGALVMAVFTLAVLVLFALDALQLRGLVAPAVKRQVGLSAAGAAVTGLLGAATWFLVGRAAMNASRGTRPAVASRGGRAASPLVMASSTGDAV